MVRTRAAIDAAFCSAARVTFAGSRMPALMRSVNSPVAAFRPIAPFSLSTRCTTTAPSRPALSAMLRAGATSDSYTVRAPVASSPVSDSTTLATAGRERTRAVPPPATTPSSMAARVAETASSMRCFFSLSSTSVAAPTLMTATPPANLARRSCSFSRSQSESVLSISVLIWPMRAFTSSFEPAPSTMVVLSFVMMTRLARPSRSSVTFSSLRPTSSLMTWPPVRTAMSCSIALRRSPKPGALTAVELKVPRILLTTSVASASPSTSSAMMTSGLPVFMTASSAGSIDCTDEIFEEYSSRYGSSRIAS